MARIQEFRNRKTGYAASGTISGQDSRAEESLVYARSNHRVARPALREYIRLLVYDRGISLELSEQPLAFESELLPILVELIPNLYLPLCTMRCSGHMTLLKRWIKTRKIRQFPRDGGRGSANCLPKLNDKGIADMDPPERYLAIQIERND